MTYHKKNCESYEKFSKMKAESHRKKMPNFIEEALESKNMQSKV